MRPTDLFGISSIVGGTLYGTPPFKHITNVVIDSRKVKENSLFVALSGERVDGHSFAGEAIKKGAAALLVDEKRVGSLKKELIGNTALIGVANPLSALQSLAHHHVERLSGMKRVGVTGSVGKTTTKEMIASILSMMGKTAKTPGNYNSLIGLPLSLLEIEEESEFGVFEMGIDHVGEMEQMLHIYRPDSALITNIGFSHLGKMGSVQLIAKEKSQIFHPTLTSAYIGENSPWTNYVKQTRKTSCTLFGRATTKGVQKIESLGLNGWRITYKGEPIYLNAIGQHNLQNALGAISLTSELGAESSHIKGGLENFSSVKGRSSVVSSKVTVIEDWYNSSVDSATAIIDYMGKVDWSGRKVAILGSMKELGSQSEKSHRVIAHHLARQRVQQIYLYGQETESTKEELNNLGLEREVFYTDSYEELESRVEKQLREGDLILLKGSRSMEMERLLPTISALG